MAEESAWTTVVFLALFLCSLCSAWSILHWANFILAFWVSHLEVEEAGLFHAYWAISSYVSYFCRCFLTGFDHKCSLPWNDFLLPSFALWLNKLSFFGFSEMPGPAWTETCSRFYCWLWRSWFPEYFFLDARSLELLAKLQNTWQCTCSDWKTLENQWANLQANSYKKNHKEFSQSISLCRRRL